MRLFTIGHSTLPLERFLAVLDAHAIELVLDVRAFPASRRHPHFAREALARELAERRIGYEWLGRELGGRRKPGAGATRHGALRNESFRAYAEHMETTLFAEGVEKLLALARAKRTAVMCAERFWGSCHRSFLADHLSALRGAEVVHVLDLEKSEPHRLHRTARVADGELVYDRSEGAAQAELF